MAHCASVWKLVSDNSYEPCFKLLTYSCPSKISFPIAKISDDQDEQSQQRPRQHQHPQQAVPFPGNKRSRLDVTIGHPGPAEHFQIKWGQVYFLIVICSFLIGTQCSKVNSYFQ